VADRAGGIEEVHVLTTPQIQPKQVVRNVESALMAQLGLKVDHRKISVAQTADVKPIQVLEQEAVSEAASRRKLVFGELVIQSPRPRRVSIRVLLRSGGLDLEGMEEGVDEARSRVQLAARAAVKAMERELEEGGVVLEGVRVVEAFDRKIVLAAVHGAGVVQTLDLLASSALEQRKLIVLLPGTSVAGPPVSVVYPPASHRLAKVRVFTQFTLELMSRWQRRVAAVTGILDPA